MSAGRLWGACRALAWAAVALGLVLAASDAGAARHNRRHTASASSKKKKAAKPSAKPSAKAPENAPDTSGRETAPPAGSTDEERQRSEYERLQNKAREKKQAAAQLKTKETGVLKQLHQIEVNLVATKKAVRDYTERETRLARDISIVESDLGRTRSAREMTRQQLARRLRSAFRFREDRELEFLL